MFFNKIFSLGEMWVGVCLSVVVELVPERLRTTGVGLYFFIISNIGGNMQTIVPPVQSLLQNSFKLTDLQAFRGALYIFYPGEYVLGSALFLLTLFVLKYDLRRLERQIKDNEVNSLLNDDKDDSASINSSTRKQSKGGEVYRNKAFEDD
jgi:hypothetical protein